LERRTAHVEVKRLRREQGPAVYSKRFLKQQSGADFGYWTQREIRFIGHFGLAKTQPQVARPAWLQFQGEEVERVDTQDAGPSLDDWQRLLVCPADDPSRRMGVFDDAGELALLLRACLKALHGLHMLGIVHCDIKADNLCLAYLGEPLGEAGIWLDYAKLRVIDFAFSVWPTSPGWELEVPLPIDFNSPQADYLSPRFKQVLQEDRRQPAPQAWRRLDYGVDLYALAVMLRKLLAWRRPGQSDPLEAFLSALAEEWMQRYAQAQAAPAGEWPHEGYIQDIEAQLRQHRPAWSERDWSQSRLFVPCEVSRASSAKPTALTPLESGMTRLAPRPSAYLPPLAATGAIPVSQQKQSQSRWPLLALASLGLALAAGVYFGADRLRDGLQTPPPLLADSVAAAQAACPASGLSLSPLAASPLLASPPTALAYSPDGATVAAGELSGNLLLWRPDSPAALRNLGARHQGSIKTLAYSPDGKSLVSGGSDKTLRRWSASDGQMAGAAMSGHSDKVIAAAFSADGTRIASLDSRGELRHWDADSGRLAGEPAQGHVALNAAAFAPGLASFATGKADGVVGIWDSATGNSIGEPSPGHDSIVNALAFSPDGSLLVSGGWDKALRRWDARSGQPVGAALEKHPQSLTAFAFAPDGLRFASADVDGHLRLWDARTGCLLAQAQHPEGIAALAFNPDGKTLASAGDDRTLRQWRVEAAKP
jgi:WD40 repeat protein